MDMSACNTCGKSVKNRNSIKCNLCLTKVHLKCNYLNYVDSQYIKFSNKTWHCYNCSKDLFPFTTINNFRLYSLFSDRFSCNSDSNESCLTLKPPKNLSHFFNEFNSFSSDVNNTPENVINPNYYDIDQLQTLKEFTDKSSLSLFHLKTNSLSKNIDDFERLIQSTKTGFNVIAVFESRITKNKLPPIDINIPNYCYEFCPTEANVGGTLIYIRNHLSYKKRNDLKVYISFELESTFTEICNTKKANIIIGCIYKHPSMNINEFNDDYLNEFLDKLSKENKTIFLLGDFNINLLNYDIHPPTDEFLDFLSTHYLPPHILQPSRVTTNSKTLIDNIFSNMAVPNISCGNLTASISDHLPQILVAPNVFFSTSYHKSNNYERDWSRFDQKNFVLDCFSVEWDNVLLSPNTNTIIHTNTQKSYKTFLEKFESLLDNYAKKNLKKISKNKLKFKDNSWFTKVYIYQKPIPVKIYQTERPL